MNNDFWSSTMGPVTGQQQSGNSKSFATIPDNTKAMATINAFQCKSYNGVEYYEIDWLLNDSDFSGRHVFHKIHANHEDSKKRHKALNTLKMLFNMYKLALPKHAPSAHDLSEFLNREAIILIRETSPNENGKVYNWIAEVSEAKVNNSHNEYMKNNKSESLYAPMPTGEAEEWDVPF